MKHLLMVLFGGYQRFISPLFPRRCKFYPTCSGYAVQALALHGLFKGIVLAIWRVLRCNPWSMGGLDFVPIRFALSVHPNREQQTKQQDT